MKLFSKKFSSCPYLDQELSGKLSQVGIVDLRTLRMYGSRNVFFKLKSRFPDINPDVILILEGAVRGINPKSLDRELQKELNDFIRMFS